jgi:hypothetical protein
MTRGQTFAAAARRELELNLAERLILDEIAAVIDHIDTLPESPEKRQQRILLSRLIYQLNVPPESSGGEVIRPASTAHKATRAARARWNKEVV